MLVVFYTDPYTLTRKHKGWNIGQPFEFTTRNIKNIDKVQLDGNEMLLVSDFVRASKESNNQIIFLQGNEAILFILFLLEREKRIFFEKKATPQ